jgi:hypothetical protein
MKWIDSILGRPPQTTTVTTRPATLPPEQILGLIAQEIEADRLVLSPKARQALAWINGAVAQQDRRNYQK